MLSPDFLRLALRLLGFGDRDTELFCGSLRLAFRLLGFGDSDTELFHDSLRLAFPLLGFGDSDAELFHDSLQLVSRLLSFGVKDLDTLHQGLEFTAFGHELFIFGYFHLDSVFNDYFRNLVVKLFLAVSSFLFLPRMCVL